MYFSMSWRLGRSLAARTAQTQILAIFALSAHATQGLGLASGVDAPLSASSFGDTFSSNKQRVPVAFTYYTSKSGGFTTTPR
jgi:hypothetical protein